MGVNIFRAFPTIPAGAAPGVTTTIVGSDLNADFTFLLNCLGDAPEGTIAIEGSVDGGVNFDVLGQFSLGKDSDPNRDEGSPRPFVLIPPPLVVRGKPAQTMRARVMPGTFVKSDIIITVGAEQDCDCSGSAFPGFGNIVAVDTAANNNGASGLVARADHKHDVLTAVPAATIDIGDGAAEGVALEVARSDHQHAFPAPGAAPPAVGVGAVGVASTPARSDHTHDGVTSIGGGGGAFAFAVPVSVDKSANAQGAAVTLARSDHKHDVSTAAPTAALDIGDAAAEGVAVSLARSDHQHSFPAPVAEPPAIGSGTVGVATTPARSDHTHDGVTSVNGGQGALTAYLDKQFYADSLENPDSADWAVNALAPAAADSVRSAEVVRRFDATLEEGVGFTLRLPAGTASLILKILAWPETAPAAARTVGLKLYYKRLQDGVAIPAAWDSHVLADFNISTATRNVEEQEYTILYSDPAVDLVADNEYHFELTRINPTGGTELVGDFDLRSIQVKAG